MKRVAIPTLFDDELLTKNIGQQQAIKIDRPEAIDDGIGYNQWWCQGCHSVHFPEKLIGNREKSEKIMQKKANFDSIEFISKDKVDKRC